MPVLSASMAPTPRPAHTMVSLAGERPQVPALQRFAGVGLVRGEFLFRARGAYITDAEATGQLGAYLDKVCDAFAGRPVWYRATDFWSDEAAVLRGNDGPVRENNPLVGERGLRRALARPQTARCELAAVAEVARRRPNLHLLLPFVRDAAEFAQARPLVEDVDWPNRLGSMVELPSAALCAADFLEVGVTNLLVGLNDLSALTLGLERADEALKLHPAVWALVDQVREQVAGRCSWGIGGALTPALLARAQAAGPDYITIHYDDLPALLGLPGGDLPDLGHVAGVKAKTRRDKAALRASYVADTREGNAG